VYTYYTHTTRGIVYAALCTHQREAVVRSITSACSSLSSRSSRNPSSTKTFKWRGTITIHTRYTVSWSFWSWSWSSSWSSWSSSSCTDAIVIADVRRYAVRCCVAYRRLTKAPPPRGFAYCCYYFLFSKQIFSRINPSVHTYLTARAHLWTIAGSMWYYNLYYRAARAYVKHGFGAYAGADRRIYTRTNNLILNITLNMYTSCTACPLSTRARQQPPRGSRCHIRIRIRSYIVYTSW